ncbi:hypothetical protein VTK73DRAFT_7526 [Phialemonium thermophilum]|uniref:Phosphodiesterase n=1 Tax=Phialemonium thermophilum TaxID=223376 RepID=A0ABR3WDR6_9PEZI
MEYAACNVLYVDRNVRRDRYLSASEDGTTPDVEQELPHIAENVKLLLDVFGEVHLISTGGACLSQWLDLQDTSVIEMKPTLILIDTPYGDCGPENSRSRTPSPQSAPPLEEQEGQDHEEDLYGLALLQRIVAESYIRNLSKLVVPIPIVSFPPSDLPDHDDSEHDARDEIANRKLYPRSSKDQRAANRRMVKRCLDLGATDVMASPMNVKCITNLEVHAYRAHRDAARDQKALLDLRRGRKRSWVGISEEKPFAYLREAMVSGLMSRICRMHPSSDEVFGVRITVPSERHAAISNAIGLWDFSAHDFSDDELLVAASVMFNHALSMPALEDWRIPIDHLHSFLAACRAAYNSFVPYHNFRHVVDVLQATFSFLINIGTLPPFPRSSKSHSPPKSSPLSDVLGPFEALSLLITAIGHDVGHPGVNNGFLTKLNAPLAQLYNDRSVLESFHCAAYSQILRRHWPVAFESTKMRSLVVSSILATDMGLHFEYMKKMKDLLEKLQKDKSIKDWSERVLDEHRALACALLIKCADISNVARPHKTALQWMHILSDEFSRQASMEAELSIQSSLMAPPKKDMVSLGNAQLGFMNVFVIPLFEGMTDLLPGMQYCLDELRTNKTFFEYVVAEEQKKIEQAVVADDRDGSVSPKTVTIDLNRNQTKTSPPSPSLERQSTTEKQFLARQVYPIKKPASIPDFRRTGKDVSGIVTNFDAVAELAASDPFNMGEYERRGPDKPRSSDTTEGSSVPCSGDWASGPTSATTGKMPLSPSTEGTSVVSRDSLDRPVSVPVTATTAPESTTTAADLARDRLDAAREDGPSCAEANTQPSGPIAASGEAPPGGEEAEVSKSLRKKPSRFRINALPFFRRNKGSVPPVPGTDSAG